MPLFSYFLFLYQKVDDILEVMTQSLTVSNVSSLSLNATFQLQVPFHLQDEDGNLVQTLVSAAQSGINGPRLKHLQCYKAVKKTSAVLS